MTKRGFDAIFRSTLFLLEVMRAVRYNNGPAFVHPVTHERIEAEQWYEGSAHVAAENVLPAPGEALDLFTCPKCAKGYKTQKSLDAHVTKCEVGSSDTGDGADAVSE